MSKNLKLKLPINKKLLKSIANRIAAKIKPEKIILFGSYAYGKPNKDSDLDFFIIKRTNLPVSQRYGEVSDALFPRSIPMDFIVRTPEEVNKRLSGFDPFIREVLGKGIVLYDK